MKNIMLIISLFLALGSWAQTINQTDAQGLKQGLWEKTSPEGKLIYKGEFKDNKPVGEWKRFHLNGMLRAQMTYAEDGSTCAAMLFDTMGNKIAVGAYVNGKKEGLWTIFKDNIKIGEENYVEGKKEGLSTTFYDTGAKSSEQAFTDDKPNGSYRTYHKTGSVYFECLMKEGMRDGYCQSFYDDGSVEYSGYYAKDLRDRNWDYFHRDGSRAYTIIYKGGLVQNTAVKDSVDNLRLQNIERQAKQITDPEQFIDDPSGYMERMMNPQRPQQ
ncbi:MAG: toxin-antitoxin system YwqK family antitoxin [Mangrovibacterium sp.]